jgi:branched-chain amino acid aminotransferase
MDGSAGPNTEKLRQALQNIQYGKAPDTYNWLTEVT